MERRENIDRTLKERHRILHLLDQLKQEGITLAQMEEIGDKLGTSGDRALSPLLRKLRQEKNGGLICRYTYLLDFFDKDAWLDQLIQIALTRRDLDIEGKAALLAILRDYGVDTSAPPLATLLTRGDGPFHDSLTQHLDGGDEGLVCFMEEFLGFAPEARLTVIRELPRFREPRVLSILEILLTIDDREIRRETVTAIGRVRDPQAAAALRRLQDDADKDLAQCVARSLRRLSFLGVDASASPSPPSLPPFHAAYASPFDSTGLRTVWISRYGKGKILAALYLHLHETDGVTAAWGSGDITIEDFERYVEETRCDDGVMEVDPAYALSLVKDAMYRSRESALFLPPEFYVWRRIFGAEELTPEPYEPFFTGHDLEQLRFSTWHAVSSNLILEDDFFAGWILASERVFDYADDWAELQNSGVTGSRPAKGVESVVERFCEELLVPETERIKRRLMLTADLMQKIGREREQVERVLAVGLSLGSSRRHPFFKHLAVESMDMAQTSLAEGYDPRFKDVSDD